MLPELRMTFSDASLLAQEIAHNLKHGRSFVRDASGVPVLSDCTLVLEHPNGAELRLAAQVVMVLDQGAMRGTGLELRPFNPAVLAQLEAFVCCAPPEKLELIPEEPYADELPTGAGDELIPEEPYRASFYDEDDAEAEAEVGAESQTEAEAGAESGAEVEAEGELDENELDEEESARARGSLRAPDVQQQARHEKLRKLSVADQQKIARGGELADRVMLERIYGKAVWDGLLHNPKLTVPEVARMARKGTMPRPMLELIVDNTAWIQAGAVRRALLTNPRVAGEAVMKILRATPKHELKAITKGTAYSTLVRDAARKLLKL